MCMRYSKLVCVCYSLEMALEMSRLGVMLGRERAFWLLACVRLRTGARNDNEMIAAGTESGWRR